MWHHYLRERKRFRRGFADPMEADDKSQVKHAAVVEELGHEIHVFMNAASIVSSNPSYPVSISHGEEEDNFYEFSVEDYYRILATRKEDKYLKTRKFREQEEAARRSRFTKATIRVRFPDGYIVEAIFNPIEPIASLTDFIKRILAHPEIPFYIYTTPPKQRLEDMSKDFFSVGFVPGAIVYFSYDLVKDEETKDVNSAPFLRNDIMALANLDVISQQAESLQPLPELALPEAPVDVAEAKPATEKPVKPKWFKM